MDQLINTFDRGFSLKNDDLRFIDASVRQALSDICRGLGKGYEAFIIWGAEVTIVGTTASVTEGAIYYGNEVWHVAAHDFTVPDPLPDVPYWIFTANYDADGAKLDKDLVSHNTYQLRTAKGNMSMSGSDVLSGEAFDAVPRLATINNPVTTSTLALLNDAELVSGIPAGAIKSNGYVSLYGKIQQYIVIAGVTSIDLTPAFSPKTAFTGFIPAFDVSTGDIYTLRYHVALTGIITFYSPSDKQVYIELGSISFVSA